MKRLTFVALALSLMVWLPALALAQVDTSGRVSFDLRKAGTSVCSPDPRENTKICDFPAGTKEVEIVVTYENLATDNALAVALTDEWGNAIFFRSETARESGAKSYKVTGTDVYNAYVRRIIDNVDVYVVILSDRNSAAAQQAASVLTTLEQSLNIVRQLQRYTSPTSPAQLADIITQLETLQAKAQEIKPAGQTADTQAALIRDGLAAAQQAKQLLTAANAGLQGRTDLAFLNVDTANGRKMSAKLSRGGQSVESAEWAVSTSPIPRATAEPTREPTYTPAPTMTPLPPALQTAQVATVQATFAAGATVTLPPVEVVNTPTPMPVEPTARTVVAPTQTSQPIASATSAPTGVTPGAVPATATALRLPPGAPQPALTVAVPTAQATVAPKAISAPAVAQMAPTAAGVVAPAALATATVVAVVQTEAQVTASPTTARVAGKVSFNLTPAAEGATRVAGQASGGGLPLTTIGLVVVAVALGGAALWMRRRV